MIAGHFKKGQMKMESLIKEILQRNEEIRKNPILRNKKSDDYFDGIRDVLESISSEIKMRKNK